MGLVNWFRKWFEKPDSDFVPSQNPVRNTKADTYEKFELNSKEEIKHDVELDNTDLGTKAKEFIQETGKEVADQGSYLWNELKEKVHELDDNTKEVREKLKQKANQTLEQVESFIDKSIEKSKAMDAEEANIDLNQDGLADKPADFGEALETKHKGFFDKAEKWVESQEKESNSGGASPISESNPSSKLPTLELPKDE